MNLLVYRETKSMWVDCGYGGYDQKVEDYLGEVENILLTNNDLLDYLNDPSIIILNIIKLNEEQSDAFDKR